MNQTATSVPSLVRSLLRMLVFLLVLFFAFAATSAWQHGMGYFAESEFREFALLYWTICPLTAIFLKFVIMFASRSGRRE